MKKSLGIIATAVVGLSMTSVSLASLTGLTADDARAQAAEQVRAMCAMMNAQKKSTQTYIMLEQHGDANEVKYLDVPKVYDKEEQRVIMQGDPMSIPVATFDKSIVIGVGPRESTASSLVDGLSKICFTNNVQLSTGNGITEGAHPNTWQCVSSASKFLLKQAGKDCANFLYSDDTSKLVYGALISKGKNIGRGARLFGQAVIPLRGQNSVYDLSDGTLVNTKPFGAVNTFDSEDPYSPGELTDR